MSRVGLASGWTQGQGVSHDLGRLLEN
jgi:hypothetical protein